MTTGGVSAPAYFYSPLKQIIAGIPWELVTKTVELDGGALPDFAKRNERRPSYHVGTNPYAYVLVAEEACVNAGVELHYHELVESIEDRNGAWLVTTCGKDVKGEITCKEVIDCTGDADVVRMLGLACTRDETRQPGTLEYRLGGYDIDSLDADEIQTRYEKALAEGTLAHGDFCYANQPFMQFLRRGGGNQQHVFGADTSTSRTQTDASVRARASLLRTLRFVKSLAGCENARIQKMCTYCTARDTYRIVGEATITYDDYMSARRFDDAVCYTLYFIDVHNEEGTHHEFLPPEKVPTIPFGALIPEGSKRVLAAGRILSSDRLAHSALRVEASCMAMGQVVGAAAALGSQRGVASRDVPLDDLRALLREHAAIVP